MENLSFDRLPEAVSQLSKKLENIERLLLQHNNLQSSELPDKLLNVNEAAEFLNLAVPTIYTMVSKGELPVMKRSKRLYFLQSELLEYLKAGKRMSNTELAARADEYLSNRKKARK